MQASHMPKHSSPSEELPLSHRLPSSQVTDHKITCQSRMTATECPQIFNQEHISAYSHLTAADCRAAEQAVYGNRHLQTLATDPSQQTPRQIRSDTCALQDERTRTLARRTYTHRDPAGACPHLWHVCHCYTLLHLIGHDTPK
jgi:hypothetical protein